MRTVRSTPRLNNQTPDQVQLSGSGDTRTKRKPNVSTDNQNPDVISIPGRVKRASFRADGAGDIRLIVNTNSGPVNTRFITLRNNESWTPFISLDGRSNVTAFATQANTHLECFLEG